MAIVCSPPANLPLACRAIVIVPSDASSVVLTATVASADLPAIEAAGTASPGGKGSGVICSAASPPLAAHGLDRNRTAESVSDLDGLARCLEGHGSG